MNWLILVAALILPVALGVAVYLRGRVGEEQAPPPPPTEPEFTPPPEAQPPLPEIAAEELGRQFKPPDLPPPGDNLLRADVHYIVYLYGEAETDAARLKPLADALARGRLLSQRWLGFAGGGWEEARGLQHYRHWIWATPLANRSGRLDDEQLDSIERAMERFAAGLHPVFPKRADARENARLLDKFCEEVDEIFSVYAVAAESESQPAASIAALAEAEGFVRLRAGELAYFGDNQKLFCLKTRAGGEIDGARGLSGVRFVLDLPNVSRPAAAFEKMIQIAAKMARALHFQLADEAGKPLPPEALVAMRARIETLRDKMDSYGVTAGGALARALFS